VTGLPAASWLLPYNVQESISCPKCGATSRPHFTWHHEKIGFTCPEGEHMHGACRSCAYDGRQFLRAPLDAHPLP